MRQIIVILTWCALASGQSLQMVTMDAPQHVSAVPSFVSLHSGSNTGTNAVTTLAANTATCATRAYCISLPDGSLASNNLVIGIRYNNASSIVPTVSNTDNADTYTACASEAAEGNDRMDLFYKLNATTGTRHMRITFPSGAPTKVSAFVAQFKDINAFDVCGASSGTATTTFSSGSITPTVTGDLLLEYVCNTTTFQNTGTFVAGSQSNITWAKLISDRRDGCALQWGVYNSTSAINPQMTSGTSNGYAAVGIAFKAGSQGTAPSGMYIIAEQHQTTAQATTGPFTVDMPAAGANLLVNAMQCGANSGSPMTPTGITDTSSNTWKRTATDVQTGTDGRGLGNTFYAENITGSATNTLTITTSNTGDCSFWLYAIAGAATQALTAHMDQCHDSLSNINTQGIAVPPCLDNSIAAVTGATYSPFATRNPAGFFPGNSAGISIATTGVAFNTNTSASAPSGEKFDSDTTGGENLDGPWPVDQNNALSHVANTDNTAQTLTYGVTNTSHDLQPYWALRDAFAASTATKYPSVLQTVSNTATASGTSLTCTITPRYTGDIIAIMTSDGSASAHTITVSDAAGNTIAKAFPTSGDSATIITSTGGMKSWYIASNNTTSSDAFTFTWSANNTYRACFVVEITGATALDQKTINTVQTAGGAGAFSSNSVTTSVAHEVVLGWNVCNGSCTLPASGVNVAAYDWFLSATYHGQYAEWYVLNSAGSTATTFVDPGKANGTNEGAGILTFQ